MIMTACVMIPGLQLLYVITLGPHGQNIPVVTDLRCKCCNARIGRLAVKFTHALKQKRKEACHDEGSLRAPTIHGARIEQEEGGTM